MTAIGRRPPPLSWAERCSGHADAGRSRVGGRRRGLPHPGDGGSGGPAGGFAGQWACCRAAGLEFWSLSRHRGGVSTASSWCRRQHTLSRVDVGATTRPWMPSAVWWYWNAVNVSGRPMGVRVVPPTGPNPPSCALLRPPCHQAPTQERPGQATIRTVVTGRGPGRARIGIEAKPGAPITGLRGISAGHRLEPPLHRLGSPRPRRAAVVLDRVFDPASSCPAGGR